MKKWAVIYGIIFFAVCLIPSVGLLFYKEGDSTENRQLAQTPVWKDEEGWNEKFLSDAGDYFTEHFAFRSELVTANAWISAKLLQTSSQDSVIKGSGDWLYYKDSLEDYQGDGLMSERQLFTVAHTLAMIQDYAKERDVDFAFAIAPNKNSLYGEYMPYYYRSFRDEECNRTRIEAYLESEGVNYINLYETLQKEPEVLYHTGDSHWNNKGAALAADAILNSLGKEHVSYADGEYVVRKDFEGDLEAMLYPAAVDSEEEIYYQPEPEFTYVEEVESNFDPEISTQNAESDGSLVMYRDSFGNALLPFMAEAYGNAYFSRGVPYQLMDVLSCQADTLVIERAERFLPDMAENAPVINAPIVASTELDTEKFSADITDLQTETQGIYTKISGSFPQELVETESRIFIRVNELLCYEAFPVKRSDGKEGFVLYLITETLEEENTYEFMLQK